MVGLIGLWIVTVCIAIVNIYMMSALITKIKNGRIRRDRFRLIDRWNKDEALDRDRG